MKWEYAPEISTRALRGHPMKRGCKSFTLFQHLLPYIANLFSSDCDCSILCSRYARGIATISNIQIWWIMIDISRIFFFIIYYGLPLPLYQTKMCRTKRNGSTSPRNDEQWKAQEKNKNKLKRKTWIALKISQYLIYSNVKQSNSLPFRIPFSYSFRIWFYSMVIL